MSIVGYENHHGSTGFVPGSRSRSMRTMVFAGVMLVLIWTIKKSALFKEHVSIPAYLLNLAFLSFYAPIRNTVDI